MWKKSSLKILTLVLAAALLITLINWFVDPFMKFRVNKNLKYFYTNANERYINSGIAKHMEYNTAIVGTSMVENFSITDVNALMHTKSVKLPFSGGSAQEFSILVNHLLAQDKADTIIYGLDYFAYKNMLKSDDLKGSEPPFPHEMYDDSLLSNLKYLIAYNTLKQTWNVLQNSYYTQRSKSYLHAFCWYQECHFNAQVVEDFWQEREETDRKNKYDKKDFNFLVLKKNFDTHTLSIIQAHPNIHFIIFLPPYSYLSWKHAYETDSLENILKFQTYVLQTLVAYKNVKIYDFQQEPFVYDLANYKDLYHYSEKINHLILKSIESNKNRINKQNLKKHIKHLYGESAKWKNTPTPQGFDDEEEEDEEE